MATKAADLKTVITEKEVEQILEVRQLLKSISKRCTHNGHRTDREGYEGPTAVNFGRASEACDVADDSLFNVLNVCHSYLHLDIKTR